MANSTYFETPDNEPLEVQKRVRKIKRFYKELTSWAGTSAFLIALNLFLSGDISWAKFPVFFWGIYLLANVFDILRLQREQKAWEEKRLQSHPSPTSVLLENQKRMQPVSHPEEDYSGELLHREEPIRESADLTEVRKLKRPWKDEDLV